MDISQSPRLVESCLISSNSRHTESQVKKHVENSCIEQMNLNPIMVYEYGASIGDPREILNDNSRFNYEKM